ncbi:hypothetical protein [Cryptosporangium arvum]|uniref:hypothetical protein n=1 Tax=Cryptosporangium arvum TaxID=80871 RepID=UPI0004B67CAA|nr:hypothetical protein [Cryptosporangium arvum]
MQDPAGGPGTGVPAGVAERHRAQAQARDAQPGAAKARVLERIDRLHDHLGQIRAKIDVYSSGRTWSPVGWGGGIG